MFTLPKNTRLRLAVLLSVVTLTAFAGCSSPPPMTTSDPPAKLRLERLLEFYRRHADDKKRPPQDEKAFKDYIHALPADQKQGFGMPENVDDLFVSPRDNQPYVIRYRLKFDAGGASEGVAWEAAGQNGKRYVALTNGYVEEYDDRTFNELKKK